MTTESTMSHRWMTKGVLALLMCSALFCWKASGQAAVPQVTSSVSTGFTHPTGWGNLTNSVLTTNGDWLVQDFTGEALYEFPADGSAMITLLAPGSLEAYGSGVDPGLAIDANNTLYIEGNWSNCVLAFKYDPTTKSWPSLADINTAVNPNNAAANCPSQDIIIYYNYPYQYWPADLSARYVQPKAMYVDNHNNLLVGTYDSGDSWIASFPLSMPGGVPTAGQLTLLVQHNSGYPMSITVDQWGNTYFTENQNKNSDFANPLPGVLMIPAGTSDWQTDTGFVRVDPNLPDVTGVASDPQGNLYVSDGLKGVVMIPAATSATGLPQTANSIVISGNAAQGTTAIDWQRQILYVPTTTTQSNGQKDVAKVRLGKLDLGSTAVGTSTAASAVSYVFNGSVTPASFAIEEEGGTADFSIATGGTCVAGTAYALSASCTVNVTANPKAAGSVSAKLVMLDSTNKVLASTSLHSIGVGSAITISPAAESAIGSGLKTPSQVAVDASGNSYVADPGSGKVFMYAKGSTSTTAGVSIGTGLTAPTGIAVDGAGDVFIADSGNVIEVPYGPSGLNTAGQLTIKTGLGANVRLAADGLGNVFAADPSHAQVVKLGQAGATSGGMLSPELDFTGFTAPAAIAVDASNNVYVVDNQNLLELQPAAAPTTVITSLGAASGLAFDASGALYATLTGGTMRIPNVSGVLKQSAETSYAATVTTPTGIAIDKSGNVTLADGSAKNLHYVAINGSLAYGTVSATTAKDALLLNVGNSPLNVTGFTSSDAVDYSVTGCTTAVAVGSTCDATVKLTLGPGVQGAINSTITVNGNQANSPVAINATATGTALATSGGVTLTIASTATVNNTPITVTVAPAAGGATPTGTVNITVDGLFPTSATLSGGTATASIPGIPAGSHTFAVTYVGDRTYGSAMTSKTATVAKGTVTLTIPNLPAYVISTSAGQLPYDASLNSYISTLIVTVTGAPGLPPASTTSSVSFNATNSTCVVSPLGTPAAGQATFYPGCLPITTSNTSPNEVTPQTITSIMFSGDANYLPATATTSTSGAALSYIEVRQPSVVIAPNTASVTLSNGTGTTQLSISSLFGYGVSTNSAYPGSTPTLSLNNYSLPVSFACQGLPAYSSCTFSGGNYTDINGTLHSDQFVINTDPTKPVAVTVTIHTGISTSSNRSNNSPIALAVLFGFGLIGLASRRRFKNVRLLTVACLLTLTGATLGLTACSGTGFPQESSVVVTPSGKYAVSITAQQVGSIVVTGSNGQPMTVYGSLNQVSLPYTLSVTVQ